MGVEDNATKVKDFFSLLSARSFDAVIEMIHPDAELFHKKSLEEFSKLLNESGSGLELSLMLGGNVTQFSCDGHVVLEGDSIDYPFLRFCFVFEFLDGLIWKIRDYNRNMESERPNPGMQAAIGSWPPVFWPPRH